MEGHVKLYTNQTYSGSTAAEQLSSSKKTKLSWKATCQVLNKSNWFPQHGCRTASQVANNKFIPTALWYSSLPSFRQIILILAAQLRSSLPSTDISSPSSPQSLATNSPAPGAPPPDLRRLQRVPRHEKLWNYVTWPAWENSNVVLFSEITDCKSP